MKYKEYQQPKVAIAQFCEENGFYTNEKRSYNMPQNRSKGTKPELLLKKALWEAGVRYKTSKKPMMGKHEMSIQNHEI